MPQDSHPKPGQGRISLLGLLQLIIFLLALWWAWQVWQNAAGVPTAQFWAILALALFAGGLAQINLVGPVRARLAQRLTSRLALPVRLYPDGSPQDLGWPMFSLALAFGAPFLPLLMLVFTVETGWMAELRLIWIGLTLTSALVGLFGLYLGSQALYKHLVGGQTVVEVEADPAQAGQTVQGLVWHRSGRIPTESIGVTLAGRITMTRTKHRRKAGEETQFITHTETTYLHQETVSPLTKLKAVDAPWQKHFSFTIPEDALSSAPHTANPMIIWGLDVQVNLKGAPDLTMTFPFTVNGIDPDTDDNPDGFEEDDSNQ